MTPQSPLKVLLIEDNPSVREVLAGALTFLGHSALPAAGGEEGLALLDAGETVDLVITDLRMPDMSGWQVVKAVKARWPRLAVFVITGTPEALWEHRQPAADLILNKPVSLDALQDAISRLRPKASEIPV